MSYLENSANTVDKRPFIPSMVDYTVRSRMSRGREKSVNSASMILLGDLHDHINGILGDFRLLETVDLAVKEFNVDFE